MKKNVALSLIALLAIGATIVGKTFAEDKPLSDINIVIKTSKGDIETVVYASKAPLTAASFLNLAKRVCSGGVTTMGDIERLLKMQTHAAIVGRAIYDGHLDLASVLSACPQ